MSMGVVLRRTLEASEVFAVPEIEQSWPIRVGLRCVGISDGSIPRVGVAGRGPATPTCMRHTRGELDFDRFSRFLGDAGQRRVTCVQRNRTAAAAFW